MDIGKIVEKQRMFFASGRTKEYAFRQVALKKLKETIVKNQSVIEAALKKDLGKSAYEAYVTEIRMTLSELSYVEKHLGAWMKKKRVKTNLEQFHAVSFTVLEPYGVALVMAPWNYPFLLCMEPLIGAIAAGNCCIVKPSAYAPNVSNVLNKIIAEAFPSKFVTVVEGGRAENEQLLEQRFDYIFFTGGVTVGKLVMEKAAKYLTPITLELGGKSPCIVDGAAEFKSSCKTSCVWKISE